MRILFLAPRFHTNQVDLVAKLKQEGHDVSFIVMGQGKTEDHSLVEPFIVGPSWFGRVLNRVLNPSNDFALMAQYAWPKLFRLYRGLSSARPDAVICRGLQPPFILFSLPYFLLCRCRVVVYTQGAKYRARVPMRIRVFSWVATRLLRFRWFTTVEYVGDRARASEVCPMVQFVPFFKRLQPEARGRCYNLECPRLLTIGKFIERKNILLVLRAIRQLRERFPLSLTVIGECTTDENKRHYDEVTAFVRAHGMEEYVKVHTNKEYAWVQDQYWCHDIFLMPSVRELASISQLEAMAHGLAVICSVDNGTANYIAHGENGFIVESSVEAFVRALEAYCTAPTRILSHGRRSVELLEERYNIEECYAAFMQLLL